MVASDPALQRVGFGTSGVRGLVTDLTDAVCQAYTLSFLRHLDGLGLLGQGVVLLGLDLRPSSPRIAAACHAAARQFGVAVENCGMLPTPALALHGLERGSPAIMVTGSHIPYDRNGMKFYSPQGEILKSDERQIRALLDGLPPDWHPVPPELLPAVDPRAIENFKARYLAAFASHGLSGMRVGVYQHSSAARDLLVDLLGALGVETVALARSDDFVPVDTEAVDPLLEAKMAGWVAEHRLDAVVSTDGDGDRPLIADESGRLLRGDIIGILTALLLKPDAVVTPVSSNTALEACGRFATTCRTRIGSPFVIEAMRDLGDRGRVVGFEANGGFLTGTDLSLRGVALHALPTRDSVLPILAVLASARSAGQPVSALRHRLPPRFTASGALSGLSPERMAQLVDLAADATRLQALLGVGEVQGVDRTDGTRLTLRDGRIVHVRPSGNAPELRCYVEADSPALADALLQDALIRLGRA